MRRGELLEFMSRPLIQYASSNCKQLATDNSGLLLLLTIITYAKGSAIFKCQLIKLLLHYLHFNACAAELFETIFYSCEAGIANTISTFK